MADRMQQRRGTASQWSSANTVLAAGEIGLESDTGKFKIGDGVSSWSNLSYFESADAAGDNFIEDSEKGVANGVATLDVTGNVPASQLDNAPDPDLSGYATLSYADTAEADAISTAAADATTKADAAEADANSYTDNLIGDVTVDGTVGNTVTDRINTAISNLIAGADVDLDTLKELADAINNDDEFANTIDGLINSKVSKENGSVSAASTELSVVRNITVSSDIPSGGNVGDVWLRYEL